MLEEEIRSTHKSMRLIWTKGQKGVEGKEKADDKAKQACESECTMGIPILDLNADIENE